MRLERPRAHGARVSPPTLLGGTVFVLLGYELQTLVEAVSHHKPLGDFTWSKGF
jgi:hypothetical protein